MKYKAHNYQQFATDFIVNNPVSCLMLDMGLAGAPRRLNTMVGFIYDSLATKQGRASAAALILFVIILLPLMLVINHLCLQQNY